MSKPKVFLSREMLPECLERLQSESELEYNPDDRSVTEEEIIAGVKGKDALRYLEWVCTAKMDKELFRETIYAM